MSCGSQVILIENCAVFGRTSCQFFTKVSKKCGGRFVKQK
jgi:hypothetical protein